VSHRCNRCMLGDFEKLAEMHGGHLVISVKPHPNGGDSQLGGYEIYILYPSDPKPVWAAWIATLGQHCAC
jgi:hypothetical protein